MCYRQSFLALLLPFFLCTCGPAVTVVRTEQVSPQLSFALGELEAAIDGLDAGKDPGLSINFRREEDCCTSGGFKIIPDGKTVVVTASDDNGLMYGALEVAEQIRNEAEVLAQDETPYIKNRGIKFNIPLDIRTSAFDDSGDAAQRNIVHMWDMSFWENFFDNMARNRYNVISFWNAHPFSSMVQLKDYPDVALQDVWGTTIDPQKEPYAWTTPEVGNVKPVQNKKVLKVMTIDEKIAHWQAVMKYAHDRGIDVYFMTWNICLNGAAPPGSNKEAEGKVGKYGITNDYKNETSKDYLRKSVTAFLRLYPHVTGIGVTAGENMRKPMDDDDKERWLWETYGLGILDAKAKQPDRKINFIHRFWWTDARKIMKYWKEYPDQFDMSFKYAKARLYSSPKPEFHHELLDWMEPHKLKSWWNLRNDDIFVHRWGDPAYVRSFIKNLPYEQTAGFQMGSDGYVWGREFISKDPEFSGQPEIEKHWFRFLLWGRLGYNPDLPESRILSILAERFPEIDAKLLLDTWSSASKIIPLVNTFHFQDWDYMWQPEGCFDIWNQLKDVNSFRVAKPMKGSGMIGVEDFVARRISGKTGTDLTTPGEVAYQLKDLAVETRGKVDSLLASSAEAELRETLLDMKAMAHLGEYYGYKINAATDLEFFVKTKEEWRRKNAITYLSNARDAWANYAKINTPRYKSQALARVRKLDWDQQLKLVEKDIEIAKQTMAQIE